MPGWTLTETHPTHGRTFQRPLDQSELIAFWDSHFSGTEDLLGHAELRLSNPSRDPHLFSDANIVRAWLSTKRRYPLTGATIQQLSDDSVPASASVPHFVVRERNLAVLLPNEIVFEQVTSAAEVEQRIAAIWDGPRPLSDELLLRAYALRETERTDVLHLVFMSAHVVTDDTGARTVMRSFFDTLARGDSDSEPAQIPLEERLAMVVSTTDLEPAHLRSFSSARRRWRRAAAAVIFQQRMGKWQGGHTLPCRRTAATPYTPARTGTVSTLLTEAQTNAVISNCRMYGITFGNAYLALAQVAMTRVLYRRYLRGDISEEEWEYRKRQPHAVHGPLSLRPYLDREWFKKGGGGEVMLSLRGFYYQLPFMALDETAKHQRREDLLDGAPPFSDLLPVGRFLHRVGLIKKQAKAFFGHPLFLELLNAATLALSQHILQCALEWEKANAADAQDSVAEEPSSDSNLLSVAAYECATLGNLDSIFPIEYPLPASHPLSPFASAPHPSRPGHVTVTTPLPSGADTPPTVVMESDMVLFRSRPADLYISAFTSRGRLKLYSFYDRNVYEDGVVTEWLDEVKGAMVWYLGQTHAVPADVPKARL